MANIVPNSPGERFHDADKYAAYLKTLEGRLRLDLAFAHLREFLPQDKRSLRTLDIGCGTGATAVRLAQLGFQVTMVDASSSMLNYARHAAQDVGVAKRIAVQQSDASQLASLFEAGSFDVIVCHNLLEYIEDPSAVLRDVARMLRDTSGVISILVRNQAGDVLKSAIQTGDLSAAENSLGAQWGREALYGGQVRLFRPDGLYAMMKAASLAVIAERGVRVLSDYLPARVFRDDEYERVFELERKLGARPDFAAVARYVQLIAHHDGVD
jgi:S-adenosylmethionine-dependent methyltransferase